MIDHDPQCHCCGETFLIHPSKEMTDYCDECAQRLVPELLGALESVVRIADRKTLEFDDARKVMADATKGKLKE